MDKSRKIGSDLSLCAVPAMQNNDHEVRDCDTFQRKKSRQEENTVVPSSVAKKVIGMAGKLKSRTQQKTKGLIVSCLWMKFNPVYPSNMRKFGIWGFSSYNQ